MKRDLEERLVAWKESSERRPLLLRGARQVGKTYLIDFLGNTHFDDLVEVNFELEPGLSSAFETLQPAKIVRRLELLTGQEIRPGKTLLFLDEIQECPQAIAALRYFKEQMPEQHVAGAGSLLEFALDDAQLRMPVGRVQFLRLYPLTFAEFLDAMEESQLRTHLEEVGLAEPVSTGVHKRLLELVRLYTAIGGMPAAVKAYRRTGSLLEVQSIQNDLLATYRNDFGKYARQTQHEVLQRLLERVPGFLGQWIKYVKLDSEVQSRELRRAIELLSRAGLFHVVTASKANGLPLAATANQKKFKLLFLDIGLAHRAAQMDPTDLLSSDTISVNRGAIAEQLVGQELMAQTLDAPFPGLFSWTRERVGSSAEIDFVVVMGGKVIPIEVKAGMTGRLKSLRLFMKEKESPLGIRVSSQPLSLEDGILSVPFYMLGELQRLIDEAL